MCCRKIREFILELKGETIYNKRIFHNKSEKKKYFQYVEINNWQDFRNQLGKYFSNTQCGTFIYRGCNNASYRLYSSIQRHWMDERLNLSFPNISSYIQYQIKQAKKDTFLLKNILDTNDYNVLAALQHYEGFSPLIDFSYNPETAIFFAQYNVKPAPHDSSLNDYISLYVIDHSHPCLQGVSSIYSNGATNLNNIIQSANNCRISPKAGTILQNFVKMPYDKTWDGLIVHSGYKNTINIFIPYFNFQCNKTINNVYLDAQNGCFIQSSSDEVPLEEFLISKHQFLSQPMIKCYDIHKDLINQILMNFKIPSEKEIFPDSDVIKSIKKHVKKVKKNSWLLGEVI